MKVKNKLNEIIERGSKEIIGFNDNIQKEKMLNLYSNNKEKFKVGVIINNKEYFSSRKVSKFINSINTIINNDKRKLSLDKLEELKFGTDNKYDDISRMNFNISEKYFRITFPRIEVKSKNRDLIYVFVETDDKDIIKEAEEYYESIKSYSYIYLSSYFEKTFKGKKNSVEALENVEELKPFKEVLDAIEKELEGKK